MGAADAVLWALERNWDMVAEALEGLDDATMNRRPAEHSNSIAWIFWHMNRVVDIFINARLQSAPQLWVSGGWNQKYSQTDSTGGKSSVVGALAEDIAAWDAPPKDVQIGYFEAVKSAAREYIASLSEEDLAKRVTFPPEAQTQDHTIATALGQLVWDNVAHGGQIAYLRGLFCGMGWHR